MSDTKIDCGLDNNEIINKMSVYKKLVKETLNSEGDYTPVRASNSKEDNFMTMDFLVALHGTLCEKSREIIRQKNYDYTGDDPDIFKNFRKSEHRGIPAEIGLLLRVDDKLGRIETFVKKRSLKVGNESVEDSVIDVINYMVLVYGIIKERNQK